MTGRTCITADLDDYRTCTVRGQHRTYPPCDGYQHVHDSFTRREKILDTECTGCLPTPADLGYLCRSHLAKLDDAIRHAPDFARELWELNANGTSTVDSGGGHAAAGPRWPLVESRLQAGWIVGSMLNAVRALDGETRDPTFVDNRAIPVQASPREVRYIAGTYGRIMNVGRDELISTPRGAEIAIRFITQMQSAMRAFPLHEEKSRIAGVRCENCHLAQLIWEPPLAHLGDVVIRCANCGHEEDQDWLEQWSGLFDLPGGN